MFNINEVVSSLKRSQEFFLLEFLTFKNICVVVAFLLIFNQLIELYQFRNMPPGLRLSSLPLIGNFMSFD